MRSASISRAAFTYRVEVFEGTTSVGAFTQAQASGNQSAYTLESDLKYDTVYRWRVRGEMSGAFTAWSALAEFRTPTAPAIGGGGGGGTGTVGANRSIELQRGVRDHPGGPQRRAVESRLRLVARGAVSTSCGARSASSTTGIPPSTRRVAILTGA